MSNLEQHPTEQDAGSTVALALRHDVLAGREVPLGRYTVVNRLLPHTNRRMVGAWCFLDHFGPDAILTGPGMQVPPHPHCGLQTVTWLLDGEVLHRDSVGSLAMIRPGQLNLMTAGHGIAHSEQSPDGHGPTLHGLQLWIALPEMDAAGPSSFEHHADLPTIEVGVDRDATTDDRGAFYTVVVGEFLGQRSPARVHTPIVGVDIRLAPGNSGGIATGLPLRKDFEYAILALAGAATADGTPVTPGNLVYLGDGRTDLPIETETGARLFLLGGEPFADELVMWWNFVARSHDQIVAARDAWMKGAAISGRAADGDRFGAVSGYEGPALPAPEMPTTRLRARDRHGRRLPGT